MGGTNQADLGAKFPIGKEEENVAKECGAIIGGDGTTLDAFARRIIAVPQCLKGVVALPEHIQVRFGGEIVLSIPRLE